MDERSRHRQFEEQVITQLRTRALALTQGKLPADRVVLEQTREGADALRSQLTRLGVYDRDALEKLAGARSGEMTFLKKTLYGLFYRALKRIRVRVIAPVDALLKNQAAEPATREDVLDALAYYDVLPARSRPDAVVLASATGFSPEARALAESRGQPALVLVGGRTDGGLEVTLPPALRKSQWAELFALESQGDRLKRLMYHLEQDAVVLDSRGIPLAEVAQRLGLPPEQVEQLIRQACRTQSRLMTVVQDGVTHVCRTPLAEEGDSMSIWSRIRRLLRMKPTVAERVREMTAQRVQLEQSRYGLDQKIDKLESDERQALAQGAAAASDAERKQVAGRLMRVRTELKRQRTQAQLFTQQIDIIGTHIHHLTLAEQGRRLELPRAEELTREAAQAEQVITEVAANADLARGIEVGAVTPLVQEQEAAILEEFKQIAASKSGAGEAAGSTERSAAGAGPSAAPVPAAPIRADSGRAAIPPIPAPADKGKARPELG